MKSTLEQKEYWQKHGKKLRPSKFINVIPSENYNPPPKPPSRIDLHRLRVKLQKEAYAKM